MNQTLPYTTWSCPEHGRQNTNHNRELAEAVTLFGTVQTFQLKHEAIQNVAYTLQQAEASWSLLFHHIIIYCHSNRSRRP